MSEESTISSHREVSDLSLPALEEAQRAVNSRRGSSLVVHLAGCCLAILHLLLSVAAASGADVVAWGNNGYGNTTVPASLTNVVAIAGG